MFRVFIAPNVPVSYTKQILVIADSLAKNDEAFSRNRTVAQPRTAAFNSVDAVPRLFGTALRLQSLMALAKYGPGDISDLRHVLGGNQVKFEGRYNASFGRGDAVRVFDFNEAAVATLVR